MAEPPFPWNLYEEKQKQLMRSHRITNWTWGIENSLDKLLTAVESGTISTNQAGVQRNLEKDISSSVWTERNRARLRRKYLPAVPELDPEPQRHPAAFAPSQIEGRLHARIRLSEVRGRMTSAEWKLIIRVAAGFDCNEMAKTSGVTAGNVRTKLSRLRARLKREA